MLPDLFKYPRTPHAQGSNLQPGDEDLAQVKLRAYKGMRSVIEEKFDGANCAISFAPGGQMLLQSRGHYLAGGPREEQFDLLKAWARLREEPLRETLGPRRVLFGEWMFATHTCHYDALPAYFLEFDVYDRQSGHFLSTPARRALLADCPFILPAAVLYSGPLPQKVSELAGMVGPSLAKSPGCAASLNKGLAKAGLAYECASRYDAGPIAEGLYIKIEDDSKVLARLKFVRPDFVQAIKDSETHWHDRAIVPNKLADGCDPFDPAPCWRLRP